MLKITKVKVYPYSKKKQRNVIGIGQIVLNDCLLMTGIEIAERNGTRFIRYPKNFSNNHKLCFFQPIEREFAKMLKNALLTEYDNAKANVNQYVDLKQKMDKLRSSETDGDDFVILDDSNNDYMNSATEELLSEYVQQAAMFNSLKDNPSNGPEPTADEDSIELSDA